MATPLRTTSLLLLLMFAGSGWAANVTVTANANLTFTPRTVTISAGDTVTFTNAGGSHNVHSTSGPTSFRCSVDCVSNNAPNGSAWSDTVMFPTAGTVNYQCDQHASLGMVGSIVVNAVTPPPFVIGGYMSGNWYRAPDPDGSHGQGGHGFQLEFTNLNNGALAIWFVYAPVGDSSQTSGSQNWIYAQGSYDPTSNTVTLPAIRLTGAKFPPNFVSTDVKGTPPDPPWGTLTFTFSDCNHGTASWVSTLPGYGSGTLPITRLTQIAGTTCP